MIFRNVNPNFHNLRVRGGKYLMAVQGFGRPLVQKDYNMNENLLSGSSIRSFTPDTGDMSSNANILEMGRIEKNSISNQTASRAATMALKKAGLTVQQIDLIKLHEAFAAQTLANMRELGITEKDYDRVNVNGSCVSIGHPLVATGARILITLLNEMRRRRSRYGMIAICGGGGMGVSGIIERT
jgi:3-oxoacyl-[acyl-carrier-protein] synthase III